MLVLRSKHMVTVDLDNGQTKLILFDAHKATIKKVEEWNTSNEFHKIESIDRAGNYTSPSEYALIDHYEDYGTLVLTVEAI